MAHTLRTHSTALLLCLLVFILPASACTSFIITPGASADGSMYVGHTNDGFGAGVTGPRVLNESTCLVYVSPADYLPGSKRAVYFDPNSGSDEPTSAKESQGRPLAYIPEVKHTYGYFTGSYGIMNEHQLMSGEVTTGAKVQPNADPRKRIFYSSELSNVALERTSTARDAVVLVGSLIDTYGYYGTGETLLFADPCEAWVIEMCGYDMNGTGGLWVAQRVPDGEVFVTANTFQDPHRETGEQGPNVLGKPLLRGTEEWLVERVDGRPRLAEDRELRRICTPVLFTLTGLEPLQQDRPLAELHPLCV